MKERGDGRSHVRRSPERLNAFSDGVFAVLITVLVLELRPPELPTFKALLSLWPTWLSYAVSYLFIAIVWANHHHLMRYAEIADRITEPCRQERQERFKGGEFGR